MPLFYLDAIWHKPDRTHISREEYGVRLGEILALDSRIIDGNYSRTIERRILACDTVFLFDLPVHVCLDGAISHLGKAHCDMPWIDTELDPGLKKEIEDFSEKNLPAIYALINKYKDGRRSSYLRAGKKQMHFLARKNYHSITSTSSAIVIEFGVMMQSLARILTPDSFACRKASPNALCMASFGSNVFAPFICMTNST